MFEPGDVRLHHGRVTVEREDQGHVDVPALADHLLDRREARLGGRDLHHQVATPQSLVQVACGRFGAGTVVGESRVDLDRHVPVDTVGLVVDPREHVAGAVDVGEHHRPVVVDDRVLVGGERP